MEFNDYNSGVYCLTSPSGRKYIGRTISWTMNRLPSYRNGGCKRQPKLYSAIWKYGWVNFKKEWLLVSSDMNQLIIAEEYFIRELGTMEDGYNCCPGGEGKAPARKRGVSNPDNSMTYEEWKRLGGTGIYDANVRDKAIYNRAKDRKLAEITKLIKEGKTTFTKKELPIGLSLVNVQKIHGGKIRKVGKKKVRTLELGV